MEQLPTPDQPHSSPSPFRRRRAVVPPLEGVQVVRPQQLDNYLAAVAPPQSVQEAQATRALSQELGVIEEPTGETRWGFPVSVWRIGDETAFVGPAAWERTRLGMLFTAEVLKQKGERSEIVPPTLDDIRFGRGINAGRTVIKGEVLHQTSATAPQSPVAVPTLESGARHSAPKKESRLRHRLAAGTMATLALAGAVLFGANKTTESPAKPRPAVSDPDHLYHEPTKPVEKPPITISYKDGSNTYEYQQDSHGNITEITGKLGEGENPWTLTEGAYQLIDEDAPNTAIAEADIYMDTPALQAEASDLQPGIQLSWGVVVGEERRTLKARA